MRNHDQDPVDTSEMTSALEESFEGEQLDSDQWRTEFPWGRMHNYNAYTSDRNAYIYDDRLLLRGEERAQHDKSYTSGAVSTRESFTTGYFEASIKLPPASTGFWPAFWLTPTTEERYLPEIDIFEVFSDDPCAVMTYHYWHPAGDQRQVAGEFCETNLSSGFHEYSVDWSSERIVWYIDGEERFRYDGDHVTDDEATLIINFGIEGPFMDPPRSVDLPAYVEVDWVRVWQR